MAFDVHSAANKHRLWHLWYPYLRVPPYRPASVFLTIFAIFACHQKQSFVVYNKLLGVHVIEPILISRDAGITRHICASTRSSRTIPRAGKLAGRHTGPAAMEGRLK